MDGKQSNLDVWSLASEIEKSQAVVDRMFATLGGDRSRQVEQEARLKQENDRRLGALLEEEFGRLHGWRVARHEFSLDQLAENRKARNFRNAEDLCRPFCIDHPSYYRLNGFPIAIIAQNYDAPTHREELDGECKNRGLVWEEITDFPSWHYPGKTTLILITRPGAPTARKTNP